MSEHLDSGTRVCLDGSMATIEPHPEADWPDTWGVRLSIENTWFAEYDNPTTPEFRARIRKATRHLILAERADTPTDERYHIDQVDAILPYPED